MLQPLANLTLCLASTAEWRSEALSRLGVVHQKVAPAFEEPVYCGGPVEDFVRQLALGKAKSVAQPSVAVLGFDQMIEIDGAVLGKPGDLETARTQLKQLAGKRHRLVNGVALVYGEQEIVSWDESFLQMRPLEEREREVYLARDQPFGCAGSYKIESLGASLFESVSTQDLGSILGLPGNLVINSLRQLGYSNLL